MDIDANDIDAAIDQQGDWLLNYSDISGFSRGIDRKGRPCVLILMMDELSAQDKDAIRARLAPVPVEFEKSGPITPYHS